MYANIAIQLVTFVSVGLKVVKSGGNIWGEEYRSVFFGERASTPPTHISLVLCDLVSSPVLRFCTKVLH